VGLQWLELLGLFTSLKTLRFGKEMALPVLHSLRGLSRERERALLPSLQRLFVEGYQSSEVVQALVEDFVTARQLSGQYVVVHDWGR